MHALNVAVIPARGGSQRLPNKNSKRFCGKPLIMWTIEAALACHLYDLVLVSTDSDEIAHIAHAGGASVPFKRPAELATDTATTNEVIRHAINWIEENVGAVSRVTLLQPTSPLRTAQDIIRAMDLYEAKQASAVVSVSRTAHPIQFCNTLPADLTMEGFIKTADNKRTQELPEHWYLNGAIYIFDRRYVGCLSEIYGKNTYAYIMERERAIDIDDELDFIIAEAIQTNAIKRGIPDTQR